MACHLEALRALDGHAVDLVVFPELSLSNYAPEIAQEAALHFDDVRLAPLQACADKMGTHIAVGTPWKTDGEPMIAMLVFGPGQDKPRVIGKRCLHEDEVPFFSPCQDAPGVLDLEHSVGVAICYELSVPTHTQALMALGPAVYLASVAKTVRGVRAAEVVLAETARRYACSVLMVNSVGSCEGKPAGGGSLALDRRGDLLGQLDERAPGLLVVEVETGTVVRLSL